jgi:hypothetical protein
MSFDLKDRKELLFPLNRHRALQRSSDSPHNIQIPIRHYIKNYFSVVEKIIQN